MSRNCKTETGPQIERLVKAAGHSQSSFAAAVGTSRVYANRVINGHFIPSAEWLNTVSLALNLSDEQRKVLHRSAAKDQGYEIDLT